MIAETGLHIGAPLLVHTWLEPCSNTKLLSNYFGRCVGCSAVIRKKNGGSRGPPSLYSSVACCTPCAANQLWRANAGIWPGSRVNTESDKGLQDSRISPSELTWNMIYPYMFPYTHTDCIYSHFLKQPWLKRAHHVVPERTFNSFHSFVYAPSRFSCVWLFVTLWTVAPAGSSVHGILQARTLEWVAMPSSRGSSQPRDRTWVSCVSHIGRRFFTTSATWEAFFFF